MTDYFFKTLVYLRTFSTHTYNYGLFFQDVGIITHLFKTYV